MSKLSLPRTVLHRKLLRSSQKREPASLAKLVDRIESDYQFKLGYLAIKSLIESCTAIIEVDGDLRAKRLADNLESHWRRVLPHAMTAFGYGRAAFEKTYLIDPDTHLAFIAGLDFLPFESTRLQLDDSGSFAGIELTAGGKTCLLDPTRAWWFALDPTALEPHGRSRYLGAAFHVWKEREQLKKQEEIWYSKFAIGHAVARAPESQDVETVYDTAAVGALDGHGDLVDPMDILHDRCQEIEAGGTLVLSSKSYPNGKYLYEYAESSGQKGGEPLENRREALDVAALRALGVPERALTQDAATGSYALADVHRSILFNTCEGILTQLVASYQRYVIDKAVLLNWPSAADKTSSKRRSSKSAPVLTLRTQPFGDDRRDSLAKLAETILQAPKLPPLISSGIIDLSSLLATARLPLGKDALEKIANLDQPEAPGATNSQAMAPLPSESSKVAVSRGNREVEPVKIGPGSRIVSPQENREAPNSGTCPCGRRTRPAPRGGNRKSGSAQSPTLAELLQRMRKAPRGKAIKKGPRGGAYYVNESGQKQYVDDSSVESMTDKSAGADGDDGPATDNRVPSDDTKGSPPQTSPPLTGNSIRSRTSDLRQKAKGKLPSQVYRSLDGAVDDAQATVYRLEEELRTAQDEGRKVDIDRIEKELRNAADWLDEVKRLQVHPEEIDPTIKILQPGNQPAPLLDSPPPPRRFKYRTPAAKAIDDIQFNRDSLKQRLVNDFYDLVSTFDYVAAHADSNGAGQFKAPTKEQMILMANQLADAYIDATVEFLKSHPGAKSKLGKRIELLEDECTAPWCADWAAYLLTHIQETTLSRRFIRLDPAQYNASTTNIFGQSAQHNFVVIYPRGHKADVGAGKFDPKIRMLDPWRDPKLLPTSFKVSPSNQKWENPTDLGFKKTDKSK